MASLEMMTSLAADLPSSTLTLQRRYTLQNRRQHRTPTREVNRKPPLPKLTTVNLSPSTPPPNLNIPGIYTNSSVVTPQHYSENLKRHPPSQSADHGKNRPNDFSGGLISAIEETGESPKRNRRGCNESLVIEEDGKKGEPPPIPIRKYQKFLQSNQPNHWTNQTELDNCYPAKKDDDNRWKPSSPRSPPGDIQLMVTTSSPIPTPLTPHLTNVSIDSGLMVSPSPPTDSGIAVSPFIRTRQNHNKTRDDDHKSDMRQKETNSEDALSILSYSLSEGSDTSESKYDNVHLHTNNNNVKHQSEMKDGDEESDSSSIAGNLIVESSESDIGNCDCLESGALCNRTKTNSDATQPEESLMRINNRQHDHRDSGPYENVNEQQQTTNDNRNSISEYMAIGGINSLRHIITSGQTTNV